MEDMQHLVFLWLHGATVSSSYLISWRRNRGRNATFLPVVLQILIFDLEYCCQGIREERLLRSEFADDLLGSHALLGEMGVSKHREISRFD